MVRKITRALMRVSVAGAATCAVVALGLTLTGPAVSAAQPRQLVSPPTVVGGPAASATQPHAVTSPPAPAAGPHALTSPPTVLASAWQPTTTHDSTSSHEYQNNDVSCVSSTFCMSVGYNTVSLSSFGEEWNGTSWNEVTTPAPPGVFFSTLRGVSCVTTSFCEAVGVYDQVGQPAGRAVRRYLERLVVVAANDRAPPG